MAFVLTACNESRTNYNADIIIQNAMILTMDADFTLHENGSLVIKDGEIAALGAVAEMASQYSAPVVLDGANKLLMPGLINTQP